LSRVITDPNPKIETKEISLDPTSQRRHYLLTKCPDGRPASFEFRYTPGWAKEDGRHFHRTLKNYKLDFAPKDYKDRKKGELALNSIRAKSKSIIKRKQTGQSIVFMPNPDDEDFTIDQGERDFKEVEQNRTIIDYLYKNMKAKYVRIIKNQEPIKLVWSFDKPFCTYEKVSARTLMELRRKGIDFNQLEKIDKQRFYNSFTRCYAPATHEYERKKYCLNHYRDLKFGRDIREDFNDQS
jgi:hypothetical protein